LKAKRLRGEVLAGGGDWVLVRSGGAMARDVRLTLRTDDGAVVHMTYGGRWITPSELRVDMADPVRRYQVDPARYHFRTNLLFETGAGQYAWLKDIVCIGAELPDRRRDCLQRKLLDEAWFMRCRSNVA
jgi:hypothetical protein